MQCSSFSFAVPVITVTLHPRAHFNPLCLLRSHFNFTSHIKAAHELVQLFQWNVVTAFWLDAMALTVGVSHLSRGVSWRVRMSRLVQLVQTMVLTNTCTYLFWCICSPFASGLLISLPVLVSPFANTVSILLQDLAGFFIGHFASGLGFPRWSYVGWALVLLPCTCSAYTYNYFIGYSAYSCW